MSNQEARMIEVVQKYITDNDTDLFLFSGQFNGLHDKSTGDHLASLVVSKKDRKKNAALVLTTYGGDPDSAFRVARAFQRCYPKGRFRLLVAGPCKSAGTIVALGATEIAFGPFGELGPLDVQMSKPDELAMSGSGLEIFSALDTLAAQSLKHFANGVERLTSRFHGAMSTRMTSDICARLISGLLEPIASHIDPMRLGEAQRAIEIAKAYGNCLTSSENSNLKENALDSLIRGYPCHSFVIDYRQAQEHFEKVSELSPEESEMVEVLGDAARYPRLKEPAIFDLGITLRPPEVERESPTPGRSAEDSAAIGGGAGGAAPTDDVKSDDAKPAASTKPPKGGSAA